MTTINAELILASKNAATGDILYTLVLTYPRFLLSEVNTHRAFSRNTSSSRAIPMKKIRRTVLDDPFLPYYIGAAQKGMQAGAELTGIKRWAAEAAWYYGRYPAVALHWALEKLGVAKQITNRVVEPWLWVRQVVSATDLKNFLLLRTHKDAEPHLQLLARQVAGLVAEAEGIFEFFEERDGGITGVFENLQILQPGEWHLPFVTEEERVYFNQFEIQRISAARAARTSFTLVGNKTDAKKDLELGQKLIDAEPAHLSPVEHQAQALDTSERSGNFRGFLQWRKTFWNEHGGDK